MVHWTTCHDHIAHRTALSGRMRTVVVQSILHPLRLEPIIILFEYLIRLSLIYDLFRFDAISAANFRFEASISSAFISSSATLEHFCLRVVLLTLSCGKKMKCQNPLFTWAKWNDIFRDYFETHRKSTQTILPDVENARKQSKWPHSFLYHLLNVRRNIKRNTKICQECQTICPTPNAYLMKCEWRH